MGDDVQDAKEQHRLGTINRWDPPEGDWAAEHDWTRYRGPDPWPVPGGWVFVDPEGGGWWRYFGDAGVGHDKDDGIREELEDDESVDDAYDAMQDLRDEHGQLAFLKVETANPDEVSMRNPGDEKLEWTLEIDGVQVFRRVEPDRSDTMAAVAEALQAYHAGDLDDRRDEIVPTSGRKPDDVREQEQLEERREENEQLDEFVPDGGQRYPNPYAAALMLPPGRQWMDAARQFLEEEQHRLHDRLKELEHDDGSIPDDVATEWSVAKGRLDQTRLFHGLVVQAQLTAELEEEGDDDE